VKNKHLKLSIVIALVALTLSLLFLSSTGKRTQSSSTPTAPGRTLRPDAVTTRVGR
jgi:Flp pilus assembly protein CpaB